MSGTRPRLGDLTPEELERLALEHVESMFIELHATGEVVRERCRPVRLIKRHPLIAAGLAAAATVMLVRQLRRQPAGSFEEEPAAAALRLFRSLLIELVWRGWFRRRRLPELVASWLIRRTSPN